MPASAGMTERHVSQHACYVTVIMNQSTKDGAERFLAGPYSPFFLYPSLILPLQRGGNQSRWIDPPAKLGTMAELSTLQKN